MRGTAARCRGHAADVCSGGVMAGSFGADSDVAWRVSGELAEIRATLADLGKAFDGLDGVTGSAEVEKALGEFVGKSSDSRKKMDGLLERASGLLRGLAEGMAEADGGLYTTLVDAETDAAGRSSPRAAEPAPAAAGGAV
jgi:hypothetical protein